MLQSSHSPAVVSEIAVVSCGSPFFEQTSHLCWSRFAEHPQPGFLQFLAYTAGELEAKLWIYSTVGALTT